VDVEGRSAAESQRFETDHFSSVGALIIGRRMADLGIGPWGDEPTFHAPVFVVTHRPAETIVKSDGTSYIFVTEGIEHALVRAREAAGSDDVQVNGGADIARQYLKLGAIEKLRLHLVPVTLGAGTRLFGKGSSPSVRLRPTSADTSPLATHLTYTVERAATDDDLSVQAVCPAGDPLRQPTLIRGRFARCAALRARAAAVVVAGLASGGATASRRRHVTAPVDADDAASAEQ
jgi:dihydrofolate reductase